MRHECSSAILKAAPGIPRASAASGRSTAWARRYDEQRRLAWRLRRPSTKPSSGDIDVKANTAIAAMMALLNEFYDAAKSRAGMFSARPAQPFRASCPRRCGNAGGTVTTGNGRLMTRKCKEYTVETRCRLTKAREARRPGRHRGAGGHRLAEPASRVDYRQDGRHESA